MTLPEEIVVTWLLNSAPDPQRGVHLPASVATIGALRDSVHAHGRHLVVLHDCLAADDDAQTTFVRCDPGGNPYWRRWELVVELLLRPDVFDVVRKVWCVDGTDVEMLADPFPHTEMGRLYVGSEDAYLGQPVDGGTPTWLRNHCPSVARWLERHADLPVLNVGTVGGSVCDVLELAIAISDHEPWGDDYEMGVFNLLVRERWAGRFVTGHPVHTPFLRNERTPGAWWRHK